MRVSGGDALMDQTQDMIAYWDFNEPDDDRHVTPAVPSNPTHPPHSMCAQWCTKGCPACAASITVPPFLHRNRCISALSVMFPAGICPESMTNYLLSRWQRHCCDVSCRMRVACMSMLAAALL